MAAFAAVALLNLRVCVCASVRSQAGKKGRCYKAVIELRQIPLEETFGSLQRLKGLSVGGLRALDGKKAYRKRPVLLLFAARDVRGGHTWQ